MGEQPEGKWVSVLDWTLLIAGIGLTFLLFMSVFPELMEFAESEKVISFVTFDETPSTRPDNDTNPEPELLRGHGYRITHLRLSPDGSRVLTADDAETIKIWERASMQPVRTIRADGARLKDPRFLPGRNSMIAILEQSVTTHYLIEWNLATGTIRRAAGGRLLRFITMDVSRDGAYLAVANENGRVYLVNTSTWETLRTWELNQIVDQLRFTPQSNRLLAQSSASVALLDPDRDQAVRRFDLPDRESSDILTRDITCSPDEQWFIGASPDGILHYWDVASGEHTARVRTGRTKVLELAAVGNRLFVGGASGYNIYDLDPRTSGAPVQTNVDRTVLEYHVSREREQFGFVTDDHELVLRAIDRTEAPVRTGVGNPYGVTAVDVTDGGRSFYLGLRNGRVLTWSPGKSEYRMLADVEGPVEQVEIAGQAGLMAVRHERKLYLYSVSGTLQGVHRLKDDRPVRFRSDGRVLAAGGPWISIYQTDPWKRLNRVDPHKKAYETPMGFHRRGRLLQYQYSTPDQGQTEGKAGDDDRRARLGVVSLETNNVLWSKQLEEKRIRTPKLSPDGTYLITRLTEPLFDTQTTRVYRHQSLESFVRRLRAADQKSVAVYETASMDPVHEFRFRQPNVYDTHVSGHRTPYVVHLNQNGELAFRDLTTGEPFGRLFLHPGGAWTFVTPDQRIYGGTDPTKYAVDVSWSGGRYRVSRPTERVRSDLMEDVFLPYVERGEEQNHR